MHMSYRPANEMLRFPMNCKKCEERNPGDHMEMHEVYHRNGTPTGRIVEKHAPREAGQYFLHAILILKCADSPSPGAGEGLYIMQQRSLHARYYAGKWDVTGGGVQAGESVREAAVREAWEELGIRVTPEELREYHQYYADWDDGSGLIITVYACRVQIPDQGFSICKEEVNDVKIVPFHTFRLHVMDHNDEAFGRALDRIEAEL